MAVQNVHICLYFIYLLTYLVLLIRLAVRDSDKSLLDLHGLSSFEAVHVFRTMLSKREAGKFALNTAVTRHVLSTETTHSATSVMHSCQTLC